MTEEEEESEVKEKVAEEEKVLEFGPLKDYSFTFKLKPRLTSPKLLLLDGETMTETGEHQPSEATCDVVKNESSDSSVISEIRFCERYLTKRQISAIEASHDSLTAMVTELQSNVKPNSKMVVDQIENKAKRDICEIVGMKRSELELKSCPEKEFLVCVSNCDNTSVVKKLDQRHLPSDISTSQDLNIIVTEGIEPKSAISKNDIIELKVDHDNDQKRSKIVFKLSYLINVCQALK